MNTCVVFKALKLLAKNHKNGNITLAPDSSKLRPLFQLTIDGKWTLVDESEDNFVCFVVPFQIN
jgi:hypothetical protein